MNGWAYVGGDNNITILNGTTVVTTLQTGAQAGPGTFDPATGWVYFALSGNERVAIINGTSVLGWLSINAFPAGIAYDSANQHVYIAVLNEEVTIISNLTIAGSVSVSSLGGPTPPQPLAIAYDSADALMDVLVGNVENPSVASLNGTGIVADTALPTNSNPSAMAYDPANGFVYVADTSTDGVSVLNGTSYWATVATPHAPYDLVVDNSTGAVYAFAYGPSNVSSFRGFDVIIGTVFNSSLTVGFTPEAAVYDWQTGFLCVVGSTNASEIPGVVALVSGTNVLTSFSIGNRSAAAAFDPFNGLIYVPLNVQTANQSGALDLLGPGTFFNVTVTEVGLPTGVLWFVNERGVGPFSSTAQTMLLGEQNGTFRYSSGVANSSRWVGSVGAYTVSGKAVSVSVTFTQGQPIVITEKGLPTGMEWWVNFTGGDSFNSTATTVAFSLSAGTWTYTLHAANADYAAKGKTFTVHSPISKSSKTLKFTANFKLVTFEVTVTETGLPHGSKWCVVVAGGATHCSTGTTLKFKEANGTYTYALTTTKKGYTGAGGSFTVDGAVQTVPVTFTT